MTTAAFMLAAGIGDVGEVLFIIVVVVLALIGKFFQKNAEKSQEKKDEQRAGEDRETIARRRPDAAERPAPPMMRAMAADRAATSAAPPAPPAPAQPVLVAATEGPLENRHLREMERAEVSQALASQRIKGARVSSRRKPGNLDAIGGQTEQPAVRMLLEVDLSRRSQARQAIIYHEIFSPPKALRTGKEMWDR